jgi:hypothetical protein
LSWRRHTAEGTFQEAKCDRGERLTSDFPAEVLDVDAPRDFDVDVGIADGGLFAAAQGLGIPLRSGGSRTARLTLCELDALGLGALQDELTAIARREVNFMLFRDIEDARARGLNIVRR